MTNATFSAVAETWLDASLEFLLTAVTQWRTEESGGGESLRAALPKETALRKGESKLFIDEKVLLFRSSDQLRCKCKWLKK